MTDLEKKPEEIQEEVAEMPEGESSEAAIDDDKPIYNKHQVTDVVKRERLRAAERADSNAPGSGVTISCR